jgi:CheY-like chemotaxis protein
MNTANENCLVVLVEDDEGIRSAFAEVLQAEGYEVLAFANGREALDGLDRSPCLILLDWMMPVMSGRQFLEARSTSRNATESPVVVVSAMEPDPVPGVDGLVGKPIDVESLLSVVRRYCRHGRAPACSTA